jgi:ketosteroid isomerase-like protein
LVTAEESTTPDLVELARRLAEAANRRDIDAILRFFAPDAVSDMSDLGFGIFKGAAAIRASLEDWWNIYEEYEFAADEITRLGETVVLTINTQAARLAGSSGHLRLLNAFVLRFEDTLVARWTVYRDIDQARAAAERLAQERADV